MLSHCTGCMKQNKNKADRVTLALTDIKGRV